MPPKKFKAVTVPEETYLLVKKYVEEGKANSVAEFVSEAIEGYAMFGPENLEKTKQAIRYMKGIRRIRKILEEIQ